MARREVESLMGKLRQLSEDGAASFFSEVMASERLRKGLGRAGERFLSNKESFNSNVESILDFVNIPSKRDVRELKSRLDTLSTQLVNLSMKVDRMMAQDAGQTKSSAAATEDLGTTARIRGGDDKAGKSRNKTKRRSK
jgi:polyhydroxyalkanoate synthesis regulator phasin